MNYKYIALIGIIGLFLYFGFFSTGTLIGVGHIPVQTKSFSFDGISGIAESGYFGTISSIGALPSQYWTQDGDKYYTLSICGDNDGKVSISNSLSDGDKLLLISSMNMRDTSCNGGQNYVKTKITVPKGNLNINCQLSASESKNDVSSSSCQVGSYSLESSWKSDCARASACIGLKNDALTQCLNSNNFNEGSWNTLCQSPKSESKTITFDKPTEIDVIVKSTVGNTGGSSATLTLDFVPYTDSITGDATQTPSLTDSPISENECVQNIDCISTCGSLQPTCYNNQCFCDDKKEEVVDGTKYIQKLNIFQKIWVWILELFK